MKHYHLILTSKTEKSLYNLLHFLKNRYLNLNIIKKDFKRKKRKKILTILESPHVYKTAQEQFQYNFFSAQITIYSNNSFQSLIFLKKIKNNLFPDVNIQSKFSIKKNLSNKTQIQMLNPNNFKLNNILNQKYKVVDRQKKNNYKQIENIIKIFDIYGEISV